MVCLGFSQGCGNRIEGLGFKVLWFRVFSFEILGFRVERAPSACQTNIFLRPELRSFHLVQGV